MDNLIIAGKTYSSRLLVGTGKYKDFDETRASIDASGAQFKYTELGILLALPVLLNDSIRDKQ